MVGVKGVVHAALLGPEKGIGFQTLGALAKDLSTAEHPQCVALKRETLGLTEQGSDKRTLLLTPYHTNAVLPLGAMLPSVVQAPVETFATSKC